MGQLDRVREARRAAWDAAARRWRDRAEERAHNRRELAAGGAGAADSPQRNARFSARAAILGQARELHRQGRLPSGIERRMGPTLDYTPFAPSEAARTAGRPVARIVTLGGPDVLPEGLATGFLVTPRLLMTNHHVFPTRADARGVGANLRFERTERGQLAGTTFELDPEAFFVSDEGLDYAVVAVAPRSAAGGNALEEFGIIALIEATPKILVGQPVNIIQHPEGGPKQYAVSQNRLVDILDDGFLHYETDTLEGSSGSPAFSTNWELVALHHAAIPEMRDGRAVAIDGGPWAEEMGDDRVRWIANEGTRVSAIVRSLARTRLDDPGQRAILASLLASTTDPVDELTQRLAVGEAGGAAGVTGILGQPATGMAEGFAMAGNQFNFTGPVTIHVYAPAAALTPAIEAPRDSAGRAAADVAALERSIRFDPDYDAREGYDPFFLSRDGKRIKVPAPGVVEERAADLLRDDDGEPLVLKYHHFELAMNRRRRLQMWSAVNVDYDPAKKTKREGGREGFGRDKWVPDPRIPESSQIVDKEFYKPAGNIDRGHVVRREDNAWGETEEEIEFANSDTFHWTNCTPQHEAFNQSDPGRNDARYRGMKGVWGDFENHIQQSLAGVDTKACILAGPVLDDDNDPAADFGLGPIRYPLRFWKVVAVTVPARTGGGGGAGGSQRTLRVFGFVLDQRPVVERFGIERRFEPGRFARFQLPLRRITELAGVTFDEVLHAADAGRDLEEEVPIAALDEVRGLRERRAA